MRKEAVKAEIHQKNELIKKLTHQIEIDDKKAWQWKYRHNDLKASYEELQSDFLEDNKDTIEEQLEELKVKVVT